MQYKLKKKGVNIHNLSFKCSICGKKYHLNAHFSNNICKFCSPLAVKADMLDMIPINTGDYVHKGEHNEG